MQNMQNIQNTQNVQNMQNVHDMQNISLREIFSSFSLSVLHLINQNVMKSKVQCPDSISRTCLSQKFGRFGSFCCKLPFLTLSPISPFPSCEQHALLTEEPLDPWGSVGRQTRLDKSHIDIAAAMKLFQYNRQNYGFMPFLVCKSEIVLASLVRGKSEENFGIG